MSKINKFNKCRICLEEGNIPIYHGSYADYNLCEKICIFGDIEIREDDIHPKHLCEPCFTALLTAVQFRKTAKESDQRLRERLAAGSSTVQVKLLHQNFDSEENDNEINLNEPSSEQTVSKSKDWTYMSIDISKAGCSESEKQPNDNTTKNGTELKGSVYHIKKEFNATRYGKQILCKICNQSVLKEFWSHHHSIHQIQTLKKECKICNYEAANSTVLHAHIQSKHFKECVERQINHGLTKEMKLEPNNENYCLVSSVYSKYFEPTSDNNKVKCTICKKTVLFQSRKEHYVIHDPNAVNRFQCKVCKKAFRHKNTYRKHLNKCPELSTNQNTKKLNLEIYVKQVIINGKLMSQCLLCGKTFRKIYLYQHFQMMHSQKTRSPLYLCDKCGKGFKRRHQYNYHKYQHNHEFEFKCKLCPYRGRQQALLQSHMRLHNEKSYECDICSKKCKFKCNLIRHIRRHGKPQHECDICKKKFYEKNILRQHIDTNHLGQIKQYPCEKCDKVYAGSKYLLRHQYKVHGRPKFGGGVSKAHYIIAELQNSQNTGL